MARRKSNSSFLLVFLLFMFVGAAGGYLFFFSDFFTASSEEKTVEEPKPQDAIFPEVDEWVTEVVWDDPETVTKEVYYGVVNGVERTGTIVTRDGMIEHFEDPILLTKLGYEEDLNLSADGAGSSLWGYTKEGGDTMQIVVMSYENEDMHENSDGVLEADCPCTLNLSVFVSDGFKPNWKELEE